MLVEKKVASRDLSRTFTDADVKNVKIIHCESFFKPFKKI